ncbi:MAG: PHB depolymerase family esterase [Rhodospirillales bacterium]
MTSAPPIGGATFGRPDFHARPKMAISRLRHVTRALLLGATGALAATAAAADCPCPSGEVTVDGRPRAYRVCVPADADDRLPVLMHLHDQGESAERACQSTGWHRLGSRAGFITVYLQGCAADGGSCTDSDGFAWNDAAVDRHSGVDETAYVRAVLAKVASEHRLDATRVHAVGLGQGGNVASLLACRAADVFAAVAPVNAAAKFAACSTGDTVIDDPVSVFPVNGDLDRTAPWQGCCPANARPPRSRFHIRGCERLPVCAPGDAWSPPVLGGFHPLAASLGYDDLPGLEGVAERLCTTNPAPFAPRPCPQEVGTRQATCYGVEECGVRPEPAQSEVLGLRLAAGRHNWQQLEDVLDLKGYLWARFSAVRKDPQALACDQSADDVYATPVSEAEKVAPGAILRCASLPPISATQLAWMLKLGAPGVEVLTGVSRFLVSYRTGLTADAPAVGSAVIVLPDQPAPGPLPLIVGGHGTAGVADTCAPSKTGVIPLVLAWAATGYPAVMPDYAGLGTEGMQPTGSLTAVALSQLDAARALRRKAPVGLVDSRVVLAGHSQGGAGALVAQGLARNYAPDLNLAAVVAFGALYDPAHPLRPARFPNADISGAGGVFRAIAATAVYSAAAVVRGEDAAAAVFQPAIRDFTVNTLGDHCAMETIALLGCAPGSAADRCAAAGYGPPRTVGELFAPETLSGLAPCLGGPGVCTDDYRAMVELTDNAVPLDDNGADMLLLAGSYDFVVPPISVACSVKSMQASFGLDPDVCVSTNGHFDIAQAQTAYQMAWVKAKLAGEEPPACPQALTLPACPF